MNIQFKRGLNANLAGLTLLAGEPALVTDTKKLYVGTATDKFLVNPVDSVAGKTGAVTLASSDVGLGNVTNESKTTMFTSPTFTGNPTAPTQVVTDSSTKIATTNFVSTYVANQGFLKTSDNIDGGTF